MIPKNAMFFDLFAEDTANLMELTKTFNELFKTSHKQKRLLSHFSQCRYMDSTFFAKLPTGQILVPGLSSLLRQPRL
ncbi:MAG: hypothetical protein SH856_01460 [Flavobacteriales bacterium]|nr:hypothetical protein [Flavobacteriales bacterium]